MMPGVRKIHRLRLSVALCFAVISGCVPMITTYPQIDAADAIYVPGSPFGAASRPSMIYFPFHGIYLSLEMDVLAFGLHIPAGVVGQLNDTTIRIRGITRNGNYDASFILSAAPHKWLGRPRMFLALPDPYYATEEYVGSLAGSGSGENLIWYLFMAKNPNDSRRLAMIPSGLISGSVTLPSITINGQRYESQTLLFTRKTFVGMDCGLCN